MRKIDITKQKVNCIDDLHVEDNSINVQYELRMDVDEYFGTDTGNGNSSWIKFYTFWNPKGEVWAIYIIETDMSSSSHNWKLTDEEEKFFLNKMEEYCSQKEGKTLKELWDEATNMDKKLCD